jgi:hypothetical protein
MAVASLAVGLLVLSLAVVLPSAAATIRGGVTDTSGAPVAGTRVVLRQVATRQEPVVVTGPDGRCEVAAPHSGACLITVVRGRESP